MHSSKYLCGHQGRDGIRNDYNLHCILFLKSAEDGGGAWPLHCWQGSCLGIWIDLFYWPEDSWRETNEWSHPLCPTLHSASAHMHWRREEDDETVALMKREHGLLANFLSKSKFLRRNSLPQNCNSAVIHFCCHSEWLHNQVFGVDISIQPSIAWTFCLCALLCPGKYCKLSCFDGLRKKAPRKQWVLTDIVCLENHVHVFSLFLCFK